MFLARAALIFAAGASAFGCNSQQKTEELIQARLDAEKVKELTAESVELKKENEELRDANKLLAVQLAALEAKPKTVAAAPKALTKKPGEDKPSPADVQAAKEQLTGGGSFK